MKNQNEYDEKVIFFPEKITNLNLKKSKTINNANFINFIAKL